MINLLPDEHKRDIRAARLNVALVRYNILTLVGIGCLLLFCAYFYVILNMNQTSALSKSNDNSTKAATYQKVRKDADEYRTNLTIASQVLANSVNYTSVVFEITKLLPTGVTLDNVTLSASDFGKETTFSAHAKSYAQATELKEKFQSSKIFTNVHFQSIDDEGDNDGAKSNSAYPIAVVISAVLNKVATQ